MKDKNGKKKVKGWGLAPYGGGGPAASFALEADMRPKWRSASMDSVCLICNVH